jgi:putative ABC transport system substrate-binding protein
MQVCIRHWHTRWDKPAGAEDNIAGRPRTRARHAGTKRTAAGPVLFYLRPPAQRAAPADAHPKSATARHTVPNSGTFFSGSFMEAAAKYKVRPIIAEVHDPTEIENTITKLGGETGSGLVLVPDNFTTVHRELIISLTAQFRIPAIYPYRYFAEAGGLLSYGVNAVDLFGRASEYVSRILRGAAPADLPVQAPTKFELVINLGTAKALGLVIPRVLLASADQVI